MAEQIVPGPWEPFQNRTHNTYWSIQRHNRVWWGGLETMLTKGGKPKRFGSKETAQRACDTANATIPATLEPKHG